MALRVNKMFISLIISLVLCIHSDTAYANFEDGDSTLFTNIYNNKLYNSVIDAARTIARPFLLQQGYLSTPAITVLDTSLIYNGVTYPVSQAYNINRNSGFYIPSSVYTNYGIRNFKIIWPTKFPNIDFNIATQSTCELNVFVAILKSILGKKVFKPTVFNKTGVVSITIVCPVAEAFGPFPKVSISPSLLAANPPFLTPV